jgi:hypothetical protein
MCRGFFDAIKAEQAIWWDNALIYHDRKLFHSPLFYVKKGVWNG